MIRLSLDLHFVKDCFTLNRNFFQGIDYDNPPKHILPHSGKFADSKRFGLIVINSHPGILSRFMAERTPEQFNPYDAKHVAAWQGYVLHKRAMPIQFILEGTFSSVPEMIMFKMSTMDVRSVQQFNQIQKSGVTRHEHR